MSPLAVPFPQIPPIAGVQLATGRAGFYKHEREDLLGIITDGDLRRMLEKDANRDIALNTADEQPYPIP